MATKLLKIRKYKKGCLLNSLYGAVANFEHFSAGGGGVYKKKYTKISFVFATLPITENFHY